MLDAGADNEVTSEVEQKKLMVPEENLTVGADNEVTPEVKEKKMKKKKFDASGSIQTEMNESALEEKKEDISKVENSDEGEETGYESDDVKNG